MNNWRESRFKAVCRVFSFCCGPTGPLVVIKGRVAVCGDAWSRTTLLKNQLLSFAKLLFALYPCRARHPRLSRPPSQAASTFSKINSHIYFYMSFKGTAAFTGSSYYITKKITKSIEGMHGVEPCLGQTLCALSVPRPASPFGEAIFTDSLNL